MAVQNIRYLIETTGKDPIYLYKDSSKYSSHTTIINPNYLAVATKISDDGNWYYLPSKDMWISSSKISVVTKTAPTTLSDILTYKIANSNNISNTTVTTNTTTNISGDKSKEITVNDADKSSSSSITSGVVKNDDATASTSGQPSSTSSNTVTKTENTERHVTNPSWSQPLSTEDDDSNEGIIPDLKKTGPRDVTSTDDEGILSGSLAVTDTSASGYLTGQYRSFSKIDFNGVLGIPYQFMSSVDRRLSGNNIADGIGRKYAEKILTRNNFIYLTPCVQDFMSDFSSGERDMVASHLEEGRSVDGILSKYGRYYTTKIAFSGYIRYVNAMCKALAIYMGIGNSVVTIGGKSTKLRNVDWTKAANSNFQKYIGTTSTIVMYVDGLSSASDDFSNDSQESQLASTVNGLSDTAKEINFISKGSSLLEGSTDTVVNAISSIASGVSGLGGGGVISAIAKNARTILSGGKLAFPEIWGDSSHDTSYSINFKFRTPDNDPVSIFLNILVPFVHLVCLTAPHDFTSESGDESNGYREPFLVRGTFKGLFSVDYGMISSMSCDRGSEGTWTYDGLPTQMDVSITLKDLYKSFYISKANGSEDGEYGSAARFVGNDGLTDYLMCLAGVNMSKPVWSYNAEAYAAFVSDNINPFRSISRLGTKFQTDLARVLDNIF